MWYVNKTNHDGLPTVANSAFDFILFSLQIVWENQLKEDVGNDCVVNVDGTDFRIRRAGRKFYSYKFRASGL